MKIKHIKSNTKYNDSSIFSMELINCLLIWLFILKNFIICLNHEYICVGLEPKDYEDKVKSSWIWSDLKGVRNVRPSFHTKLGLFGGMAYSGFTLAIKGKEPWTLSHGSTQSIFYLLFY